MNMNKEKQNIHDFDLSIIYSFFPIPSVRGLEVPKRP